MKKFAFVALLFVSFSASCDSNGGIAKLSASFFYTPTAPAAGQAVQFTDTSTGSPTSWSWDFNDGTTSTTQNPSHAFSEVGSYSVSLVSENSSGSKTITQVVVVAPGSLLAASFTYSPPSPTPGQTVLFTDTSTGGPVLWGWDFGDGSTSTTQDSSHVYLAVGAKTVTLTVTGGSGSASNSKTLNVVSASTSVIPSDRKIDWTYCGIPGGIPNRTTIYTTLNPGTTTSQINSAISNCPSGQVVKLNAGTYNNIGTITLKSNVTLRGAGANSTIVNAQEIVSEQYSFSGAATISSGYTKGSASVVMTSTPTYFKVGNLIMFDQNDDTSLVMATGGPGRYLQVVARITGKTGNALTFEPPLPFTFTAGLSPKASYLNGGPGLTLAGVEDMTVVGVNSGNAVINFCGADRCWVKSAEIINGDNAFIFAYGSNQIEVRRCYIHDAYGTPNNTDGYGVYLYEGTSNCLVEDNVFTRLGVGVMFSTSSSNAILYNYVWNTTAGGSFQLPGMNANHGPHGVMTLWEGNMTEQWQNDGYHGSTSHQVLFRNWFHGLHPTKTLNRKMIDLCRASYYHTVVGNVLGDASWNPVAYEMSGEQGYEDPVIYRLGYPNMTNNGYDAVVPWTSYGLTYPDAKVKATLLRHGNYDYYNKATVWDSGISDHNLPASLIYSSKPSYFGSLQWPPFGPDVTGYVAKIPAKVRWDAYQISGNKVDLF